MAAASSRIVGKISGLILALLTGAEGNEARVAKFSRASITLTPRLFSLDCTTEKYRSTSSWLLATKSLTDLRLPGEAFSFLEIAETVSLQLSLCLTAKPGSFEALNRSATSSSVCWRGAIIKARF